MNDHSSKKRGGGFKLETDSLPDPACASICPWALASTMLICICRYTCTLHCIVMLVLLCKDFYCYLLEISPPQPCYSSMDKLLEVGETSPIFHIRDFFFLSLLSISSQAKEMGFIHFLPLILNCKLQKYLFKKSTPVPGDLAGHHL